MQKIILLILITLILGCTNKDDKMDNIELSDGSFLKLESLNHAEYQSLKEKKGKELQIDYRKKFNAEVFLLEDGRVIVDQDDVYLLLDNLSDVDKLFAHNLEYAQGREVLYHKNPYGKAFPNQTNVLISHLLDTLNIERVDNDETLMKLIDAKLETMPNASMFKKTYFINFIAVIGEALRKKHNTEWVMILSDDGTTWNPYLKTNKGRPINFFIYLYEDIYINNIDSGDLLLEVYETVNDIKTYRGT
jgi:hypothetical protein